MLLVMVVVLNRWYDGQVDVGRLFSSDSSFDSFSFRTAQAEAVLLTITSSFSSSFSSLSFPSFSCYSLF